MDMATNIRQEWCNNATVYYDNMYRKPGLFWMLMF